MFSGLCGPAPVQDIDLSGQVALVTGAGRGLGPHFAARLAAAGAAVAVVARSAAELDRTVDSIRGPGGRAQAFPADVSDRAAVERVVAAVAESLGPVDILVNNAGVFHPLGPITETDPDDWWRSMEVNVRGPLLLMRAVLSGPAGMKARRRGRIVNVASRAATINSPVGSAYVTGKTALVRLSESVALECAEHGVAVFSIHPGRVRTPMNDNLLASEAGRRWMPEGSPWRATYEAGERVHPPQLAADLVLYLASGKADPLTGRFFSVEDPNLYTMLGRAEEIRARNLHALAIPS